MAGWSMDRQVGGYFTGLGMELQLIRILCPIPGRSILYTPK
jgi:hypothetical protein